MYCMRQIFQPCPFQAGARLHGDLRRKPATSVRGGRTVCWDASRVGLVLNSHSVRLTFKTQQPKNWDQQKIKAAHKFWKKVLKKDIIKTPRIFWEVLEERIFRRWLRVRTLRSSRVPSLQWLPPVQAHRLLQTNYNLKPQPATREPSILPGVVTFLLILNLQKGDADSIWTVEDRDSTVV